MTYAEYAETPKGNELNQLFHTYQRCAMESTGDWWTTHCITYAVMMELWDFLADDFVGSPTAKSGSYTDSGGNVYNNLYSVDIAVPVEYSASGFFGIWIPNDAASSDGSVMDMPGIKDGYTGTQSWGGHTLTFKGGYLVGVSND